MRHVPAIVLLAWLFPSALGAQVRPDTTPPGADSAGSDTAAIPLAPIRVTVLRTPLLVAETPYAVTVEAVEGAGPGLTLADALGSVPGLQVDNRYNFSQGDRISVRGLGARAQFGVRGVKVLVDGIPATLPDGQTSLSHVDPAALVAAEVVRGPASSLWGNAAGGVIQLETAAPPDSGADGALTVLAGAHGLMRYGVEAGRGGAVGLRASVHRLRYGGFRGHAAADKWFASGRADWSGERDAVRVVAHGVAYEAENPGSLSAELLAEDRTQAYDFNVVQQTGEAAEQAQLGVTWTRQLRRPEVDREPQPPSGTEAAAGSGASAPDGRPQPATGPATLDLSGWVLTRDLENPIPPVIIDLSRRAAGARASVRGEIELAGRRVDWVAGVDVEGQWDDRLNWENDAGTRAMLVLDQRERVTSVGSFAEAASSLGGPVSLVAGLRYDRQSFTASDRLVTAGDPSTDDSGSRVMDQLSPSLGISARFATASVYANVASSFETPTTTELVNRPEGGAGFNPGLEPQRARSVEGGVRFQVAGRARLHAAVHRTVILDALIPFEVPTAPGRTFYRNAGSAVHRGLELDAWAAVGGGLTVRFGYSWIDARFDDFVTADADFSGNRVPGVAPGRVTASLAWAAAGGRVALDGRWVDAIPTDDGNTATAASYTVVDLRAVSPALPLAGTAVELLAGVDNALDAEYVASVVVNAFGGRYYEPGPGRSAYLGVRVGL